MFIAAKICALKIEQCFIKPIEAPTECALGK